MAFDRSAAGAWRCRVESPDLTYYTSLHAVIIRDKAFRDLQLMPIRLTYAACRLTSR
jgi:hypothetical protein